jgi:transketolase
MGIPDEPYWAPHNMVSEYRDLVRKNIANEYESWKRLAEVRQEDLSAYSSSDVVARMKAVTPSFDDTESPATRVAVQKVLAAAAPVLPQLIAGAADLTGNTGAKLGNEDGFSRLNYGGRQVYYGIREHAMAAIANGMALHGMIIPVVGTFFVFADYMRPSVRLAALSKAKVVFIFSHDSVGVGEDGPTHQPVEHLASLRIIPGLQVIRPADARETAEAWVQALAFDGPTALVLSRQNLPIITDGSAVTRGAAVVVDASDPHVTLVGTGSEVSVCVEAANILAIDGIRARVVSAPCFSLFAQQGDEYRNSVIPRDVPTLGVEAGVSFGWERFVDEVVSIDSFGTSAPGSEALRHFGISPENVAQRARQLHS